MSQSKFSNLPRTSNYIVNDRGQQLHVRQIIPDGDIRAIVFCFHGYASHVNGFTYRKFCKSLIDGGFAFVGLDFHGHGYSEGERALVRSYAHLIDDSFCILLDIYKQDRFRGLPFHMIGHSMSGTSSLLLGLLLTDPDMRTEIPSLLYNQNREFIQEHITPLFRSVILLCPAVEIVPIPYAHAFTTPFSTLFPGGALPEFLFDISCFNKYIWSCPEYLKFIEANVYPKNPNGITYGGNIKFGTVTSVLAMSDKLKRHLDRINFPFIAIQDSDGDVIVNKNGVKMLVEKSQTADKLVVEIKGGLHDVFINKSDETIQVMLFWLKRD